MVDKLVEEMVEEMARAMRQARFERNGRGKAYDPSVPLHETEIADAQACAAIAQKRVNELEAKAVSYDHAHEDAVEMGYPSLTEALEHLEELRK